MKAMWTGIIAAAVLGLVAVGISGYEMASASTQIQAANSEISQMHKEMRTLRAENAAVSGKLSSAESNLTAAEAKLNANSSSGVVITCNDLRSFESNAQIVLSGQDSYGDNLSTGSVYFNNPAWLPSHCYKQ